MVFPLKKEYLSVDELSTHIQALFISDPLLKNLKIRGEILEFKRHSSGHVYFTLGGSDSRISCVLFRSDAKNIPCWPKAGDEVLVEGRVSTYPSRGTYQFYARRIVPVGEGAAARAKAELRKKLELEGLFDPRLKRPIPDFPMRAAVVSSPTGAAVKDVIKVARNRFPVCDLVVIPCLVQGYEASSSITHALQTVRVITDIQAVLLVRGGGSRDDLNPFDDERVVRAIRSCPAPVISGVGHQIDLTLADLASDMHAPTPSAAAEILLPSAQDISARLELLIKHYYSSIFRRMDRADMRLKNAGDSLSGVMSIQIKRNEDIFRRLEEHLKGRVDLRLREAKSSIARCASALNALSPLAALARGYVTCRNYRSGKVVASVKDLDREDNVALDFIDGRAEGIITDVSPIQRKTSLSIDTQHFLDDFK